MMMRFLMALMVVGLCVGGVFGQSAGDYLFQRKKLTGAGFDNIVVAPTEGRVMRFESGVLVPYDIAGALSGKLGVTGNGSGLTGITAVQVGAVPLNGALGVPTSGDFSTGTFTWPTFNQSTTGNAATATRLATSRTINGVGFDGTANVTVQVPVSTGITGLGTGVATALEVNVGSVGSVVLNGGMLGTPGSGNFSTGTFTWPTFNQSTTGNAATATRLQTARNINGVSFDGSADVTLPVGANPAGSGTEFQFRAGASAFGAVTNSSVSGANVGFNGYGAGGGGYNFGVGGTFRATGQVQFDGSVLIGGTPAHINPTNNILEQRNGNNAQIFRLFETDSGANDEYLEISAASGTNLIRPLATGTGTASVVRYHTTTAVFITSGAGSPESVVTAPVGSLYTRTDGGAGTTLYVKESGTGSTGWVAK